MHRHNTEQEIKAPSLTSLSVKRMRNIHLDQTPFFLSSCLPLFFPPYSIYFHRSWKPWKQHRFLSCWQQSQFFSPPSFLCFLLDSNPPRTGCCHLSCWLQALQDKFPDLVLGLVKSWIMTKAWNANVLSTRISFCSRNFCYNKHLFCNHHKILLFLSLLHDTLIVLDYTSAVVFSAQG